MQRHAAIRTAHPYSATQYTRSTTSIWPAPTSPPPPSTHLHAPHTHPSSRRVRRYKPLVKCTRVGRPKRLSALIPRGHSTPIGTPGPVSPSLLGRSCSDPRYLFRSYLAQRARPCTAHSAAQPQPDQGPGRRRASPPRSAPTMTAPPPPTATAPPLLLPLLHYYYHYLFPPAGATASSRRCRCSSPCNRRQTSLQP